MRDGEGGGERTLLVEERLADGHALADLQERVGHAADAHDAVRLVDEVLDDENLVRDLGAADDGRERPLHLRWVEHLLEGLELLLHEQAGDARHLAGHAHHRGVGAVRRAEGIVDIDVAQLGERCLERRDRALLRPDRLDDHLALLDLALALLLEMKAQVLEHEDRPLRRADGSSGVSGGVCTEGTGCARVRVPPRLLALGGLAQAASTTAPVQFGRKVTGLPMSSPSFSATGLSVIDGLGLPSGRPRCDMRITACAPLASAS